MSSYHKGKKKTGIAWVLTVAALSLLIILACGGEDPTPAVEIDTTIVESPAQPTEESGETSDPSDESDLYTAVWAGTTEEVRSLVAAGADVNARNDDGDPLLYTAIWRAEPEKVQILVDAGADINAKDSNGNPLIYTAVWRDKIDALRILVEAGADLNARDSDGDPNPLHRRLAGQNRSSRDPDRRRRGC